MDYFDFHTHIVFKQVFAEHPNINSYLTSKDVSAIPDLCSDLSNILASQIHQAELANLGGGVITGAVLYGLESYIADTVKGMTKLLKPASRHKLDVKLLVNIANNTEHAFTDFTMKRTLQRYLDATETFNVLKIEDFDEGKLPHKVNVFFVVEGCHSLVDSVNKYDGVSRFPPDEILANLEILCAKVPVISVNPTHMQQSNLCNHAFGMQMAKPDPFFPRESGLTADGIKVIQGLFNKGICADLKHMSFKSRRDLMNAINNNQFDNPQPLLCTHAAFTGIYFRDWPKLIAKKEEVLKDNKPDSYLIEIAKSKQIRFGGQEEDFNPTFNSSTINLFDEEIEEIVKSGGIIGLSMDRRILGYLDYFDDSFADFLDEDSLVVDKEYFSPKEWDDLGLNNKPLGNGINPLDCTKMGELPRSTDTNTSPSINDYYSNHVLLQLKHFLQVCHNANDIDMDDAVKCMTIGSDFDGLINPFFTTDAVVAMEKLKKYILKKLKPFLMAHTDSATWAGDFDVKGFCEKLFYTNGRDFIKKRLPLLK